jgi:hypothetical protein
MILHVCIVSCKRMRIRCAKQLLQPERVLYAVQVVQKHLDIAFNAVKRAGDAAINCDRLRQQSAGRCTIKATFKDLRLQVLRVFTHKASGYHSQQSAVTRSDHTATTFVMSQKHSTVTTTARSSMMVYMVEPLTCV